MSNKDNETLQFLKSPWVTAISLIIGLISIAFAVYTHTSSKKEKNLSIIVDQDVIPIIDSKKVKLNSFSVVDKSGKKIEGDISAFKIKIVNDGDVSIWKKDILSPIRIHFHGVSKSSFIEHSIENDFRTKIINPSTKLTLVDSGGANINEALVSNLHLKTFFELDFKILEKGDSISIAVIFLGSETPKHYVEGSVEGISKISTNKPASEKNKDPIAIIIAFTMVVLLLLLAILFFYRNTRAHLLERNQIGSYMNRIQSVLAIVTLIFIIYIL